MLVSVAQIPLLRLFIEACYREVADTDHKTRMSRGSFGL